MFENQDVYVTPYYPKSAIEKCEEWESKGKKCFPKLVPKLNEADCGNCQDMGYVLMSFARAGPFKHPVSTSSPWALMWFDGPGAGAGWYVVRTQSFVCPNCAGRPHDDLELEDEEKAQEPWWKD